MRGRTPLTAAIPATLVALILVASSASVSVASSVMTETSLGASPNWTGRWRLDIQSAGFYESESTVFSLTQRGSRITGRFAWQFSAEHGFGSPPCFTGPGGTLTGKVKGRAMTATLVYPRREGHERATASFQATLSPNRRVITGRGEMLTGECSRGVYFTLRAVRIGAKK